MSRALIFIGIACITIGLLWPWLGRIPFGRLPGDLVIDKPRLKVYFPITSMILLSLLLSAILWFWRK